MNKILLIDDDKELCALIKKSVLQESIEADCCYLGRDGLIKLKENKYQLVILDIMMPEFDGFEILEKIREKNNLPILMLTSKNDSISKVRGLRAGADDYLTKPFEMDELIARIISLIRRYTYFNQEEGVQGKIEFDGLKIDIDSRSVTSVNGIFELPPKEFDLLLFCAKHQGKILTKQQIYEEVWKEPYVYDDSNIMAIISRIRKKIEENPSNPKYIQTIKGIGYRFNKEV
ncbi:MAG: response regulator transcription factor [Lachnospiraceae bacterium]|jgi:two-component system OmpR family response regulator|nr:response regulator transcription factor [Lachnospiraceae bacterium]